MQSPLLRISCFYCSLLFYGAVVAVTNSTGKLSDFENLERLKTCGGDLRKSLETDGINSYFGKYPITLSSRHVVVNADSKTLGFSYKKEKCSNNIQQFTINIGQKWLEKLNDEQVAYYIGSCNDNIPRGFVIVEDALGSFNTSTPYCLPNSSIHNGTEVAVITAINATTQYIMNKVHHCKDALDEMCTQQLIPDFGGPIFDSIYPNKVYIGHGFAYDDTSIHIVPIYRYLKEICETTGICEKGTTHRPLEASSLVRQNEPIIDVSFPPASSNQRKPINMSAPVFIKYEVIDGGKADSLEMEVEIVEVNHDETSTSSSDESNEIYPSNHEETASARETSDYLQSELNDNDDEVHFIFESEEENSDSDYAPVVMSVVPQQKNADLAPGASTIDLSEPLSAMIIPLAEQNNDSYIKPRFSTPEELLIAFLIMLSVTFSVLMCLYGFVEYTGKPYYWEVDLGNNHV